jgi:hypothetical protein
VKTLLIGSAGFTLGVLALAAFRLAFVPMEEATHYHANFALFVDGERVDLSGDEYMEDVGSCALGGVVLPRTRGHLFTNLGFGLGDTYLVTDEGRILENEEDRTLKLVLNGQPQFSVDNVLIGPGDRLLVSYGPANEEEVLRTEFPEVPANAEEYNLKSDPAACARAHETTLWDRIRHAFAG